MIKYLMGLGASKLQAGRLGMSGKGWWRLSLNQIINYTMPNKWFKDLGLVNREQKVLGFKH